MWYPAHDRRESIGGVTKDSSLPLAGTLAPLIVRLILGTQDKPHVLQRTFFLKNVTAVVGTCCFSASTPAVCRAEKNGLLCCASQAGRRFIPTTSSQVYREMGQVHNRTTSLPFDQGCCWGNAALEGGVCRALVAPPEVQFPAPAW